MDAAFLALVVGILIMIYKIKFSGSAKDKPIHIQPRV